MTTDATTATAPADTLGRRPHGPTARPARSTTVAGRTTAFQPAAWLTGRAADRPVDAGEDGGADRAGVLAKLGRGDRGAQAKGWDPVEGPVDAGPQQRQVLGDAAADDDAGRAEDRGQGREAGADVLGVAVEDLAAARVAGGGGGGDLVGGVAGGGVQGGAGGKLLPAGGSPQ